MYYTMVMPHLILARKRREDDVANNKTIARRLDQWIKSAIDSQFLEAKSIKERMSRTKTNDLLMKAKNLINRCHQETFPMPFEFLQRKRR